MAEDISVDAPYPSDYTAAKTGRHSRFSVEEDLILLRELSAADAHIVDFDGTRKRYKEAATNVNGNPPVSQAVTWKSVRDRYKRLQEQFDKNDNANQRLSGVEGEIGETEELLMAMREARDDLVTQKTAMKHAEQETGREKEMIGQAMVNMSLKRKTSDETSEESIEDIPASAKKAKRVKRIKPGGEMERFGAHLRDANLARIELESEKLTFEGKRSKADRAESEREREKIQDLELANYKFLIERPFTPCETGSLLKLMVCS